MSQVVPHICCLLLIFSQKKRTFKGRERHIILLGIEATEAQIVKKLAVINTHLQEPSRWKENIWGFRLISNKSPILNDKVLSSFPPILRQCNNQVLSLGKGFMKGSTGHF